MKILFYVLCTLPLWGLAQQKSLPEGVSQEVPVVYTGCDTSQPYRELKQCTNRSIISYIKQEFDAKKAAEGLLPGDYELRCFFTIDKDGIIRDLEVHNAPSLIAKEEVIRAVNSIPKLQAARTYGKPYATTFALPIRFKFE